MNYQVAQSLDSAEIVHLLARTFSESEPPAVAMALSFRDMEKFLRLLVPKLVPDGLTLIARSEDTGRLAGVCLTEDFASPPAIDTTEISAKFLPIFSMLQILDDQFRTGRSIATGEYLHLFMLAVEGQFAGRGIGQGLVQACIENGLRKGYRMALTEATGRVSQSIFRKHGFVDRFKVSYRDFRYEDRSVFASIQEHENAILMDRSLAWKSDT